MMQCHPLQFHSRISKSVIWFLVIWHITCCFHRKQRSRILVTASEDKKYHRIISVGPFLEEDDLITCRQSLREADKDGDLRVYQEEYADAAAIWTNGRLNQTFHDLPLSLILIFIERACVISNYCDESSQVCCEAGSDQYIPLPEVYKEDDAYMFHLCAATHIAIDAAVKLLPQTTTPTLVPSLPPTSLPSKAFTEIPSYLSSAKPSIMTNSPTNLPTPIKTVPPSSYPTQLPSIDHSSIPSHQPTEDSTAIPSNFPSLSSAKPSIRTNSPTNLPTSDETLVPSTLPTQMPSMDHSSIPSQLPTTIPSGIPSKIPTSEPTESPTSIPSLYSSSSPSMVPTESPTLYPTASPSISPTSDPTSYPTRLPSNMPTNEPTLYSTTPPSDSPTNLPSSYPTISHSFLPSKQPTSNPTLLSSSFPTVISQLVTDTPSHRPSFILPTSTPTFSPTAAAPTVLFDKQTHKPSTNPTSGPTSTFPPTNFPQLELTITYGLRTEGFDAKAILDGIDNDIAESLIIAVTTLLLNILGQDSGTLDTRTRSYLDSQKYSRQKIPRKDDSIPVEQQPRIWDVYTVPNTGGRKLQAINSAFYNSAFPVFHKSIFDDVCDPLGTIDRCVIVKSVVTLSYQNGADASEIRRVVVEGFNEAMENGSFYSAIPQ